MTDLLNKEKKTSNINKLKKNLSELSTLIQSINIKKDSQDKIKITNFNKKKKKLINSHCFNFLTSKHLMKYSSIDTPEKKPPIKKTTKKIKNKAKSERMVTNFVFEKKTKEKDTIEEEEDEEGKIKPLKENIYYKSKKDVLSFTLNSKKKYPKIDVVRSTYNNNDDSYPKLDYSLYIPEKLQKQINILSIKTIFPIDNKYGKYTKYINNVARSIKDFIYLEYDSIFAEENATNMKYLILNTDSDNDKKLLLLDLDETLVH